MGASMSYGHISSLNCIVIVSMYLENGQMSPVFLMGKYMDNIDISSIVLGKGQI